MNACPSVVWLDCGDIGHSQYVCPKAKCFYCGEFGQKSYNCPFGPQAPSFSPPLPPTEPFRVYHKPLKNSEINQEIHFLTIAEPNGKTKSTPSEVRNSPSIPEPYSETQGTPNEQSLQDNLLLGDHEDGDSTEPMKETLLNEEPTKIHKVKLD